MRCLEGSNAAKPHFMKPLCDLWAVFKTSLAKCEPIYLNRALQAVTYAKVTQILTPSLAIISLFFFGTRKPLIPFPISKVR